MTPKIKICGLKTERDIEIVNEVGVDFAGFVAFEESKRFITPQDAAALMEKLKKKIKRVAVTVSPSLSLLRETLDAGFDLLQVHGALSEEVLEETTIPVWYAFNIVDEEQLMKQSDFLHHLDKNLAKKITGLVVDGAHYGAGKPFNWRKSKRLLKAGAQSPPVSVFDDRTFILAGGLRSENVREGIALFEPDVVDVSSSVEGTDGKDERSVRTFVAQVRQNP